MSLWMVVVICGAPISACFEFEGSPVRHDPKKDLRGLIKCCTGGESDLDFGDSFHAKVRTCGLDLTTERTIDWEVREFLIKLARITKFNPELLATFASVSLTSHAPLALDPFFLPAVPLLPEHFQLKGG